MPIALAASRKRRAAGALSHCDVCVIHDVGTHAGAPLVVMELLEGEILRERLAAGSIPVRKAMGHWRTRADTGLTWFS